MSRAAPRVYFHGNCQLPMLRSLVAEARPDWHLSAREVHGRFALAEEAETRHDASTADVIVAQPISRGYRGVAWLSLEAVTAMARPGCAVIRIPSLYFGAQLSGWGYLGAGESRLRGLKMPYNLYPAAAMVLHGMPAEAILAELLSPAFLDAAFVQAEVTTALDALRRREADGATDIMASDLYAQRVREGQVAHTVNHPMRHVGAALANRILSLLGECPDVVQDGPDHLPLPHIPLLPATEAALGLPPDPDRHFNVSGVKRPPTYYLPRLVAHYAAMDPDVLRAQLLASREAATFLRVYAGAHPHAAWAKVN